MAGSSRISRVAWVAAGSLTTAYHIWYGRILAALNSLSATWFLMKALAARALASMSQPKALAPPSLLEDLLDRHLPALETHLPPEERLRLGREVLPRGSTAAAMLLGSITCLSLQVPHGGSIAFLTQLQNLRQLALEPLPVNPGTHQPQIYRRYLSKAGNIDGTRYRFDDASLHRNDTVLWSSLGELTTLTKLVMVLPVGYQVGCYQPRSSQYTMDGLIWLQNRLPRGSVSQLCQALGHLTGLKSLSARFLNPSDDDMLHLGKLTQLEYLELGVEDAAPGQYKTGYPAYEQVPPAPSASLQAKGIEQIGHLTNLRWLGLAGHRNLGSQGLQHLAGLTNLTSLDVSGMSESYAAVGILALQPLLPRLAEVKLTATANPHIRNIDRQHIMPAAVSLRQGLQPNKLRVLHLGGSVWLTSVSKLAGALTSLEDLRIEGSTLIATHADVVQRNLCAMVGVLSNLTSLHFSLVPLFPDFTSTLVQLSGLQQVGLQDVRLTSADVLAISQSLTELTGLDVSQNDGSLTAQSVASLSRLQKLRWLSLKESWPAGEEQGFTSALASQLSNLPYLSNLALDGSRVCGRKHRVDWHVMCEVLPKLTSLRRLCLGCLPAGDMMPENELMSLLGSLTQLQLLQLDCMRMSCEADHLMVDVDLIKRQLPHLKEFYYTACAGWLNHWHPASGV